MTTELTDILPPPAAAKMQRIADEAKDTEQLRMSALSLVEGAKTKHENLQDRLRSIPQTTRWDREEYAEKIRGVEIQIETAGREIDRWQEQFDQRDRAAATATATFRACLKLLDELRDGQVAKSVTSSKIIPGDQPPKEVVARIRDQINRLRSDLHRVQSAPIMSNEARRLMREQIDRLAQSGAPDVISVVESGGQVAWPKCGTPGRPADNAIGLIAWLHRDQLIAALDREIATVSDDKNALTDKDRAAQIGRLTAAILDLERQEEAVIDAAEAAGMIRIPRRPDADPRAILGVA